MSVQIDEEIGDGVAARVDAIGLLGLLNNGLDVGDFGDGLENALLLSEGLAPVLGLLDLLVVLPDQSSP